MNQNNGSPARPRRDRQLGQTMALIPVVLVTLLAVGALVVDLGNLYACHEELQVSTQAAALAGAQLLTGSTATAVKAAANNYSTATSSDYNYHGNLINVGMVSGYPQLKCLTTTGVSCGTPSGYNALIVTESAEVKMYFAPLFGVKTLNIQSTATASAAGGTGGTFNIAIIVDTTDSMTDTVTGNTNCSTPQIDCAMAGIQALLKVLQPCAANLSTCGTATTGTATVGANVTNPVNVISLWTFPGLTSTADVPDDWCGTTAPTVANYLSSSNAVYQIVPFSSDWRSSDSATTLNSSSDLAVASDATGCTYTKGSGRTAVTYDTGVQIVGGVGTYYAGVINAAQAALVSEQTTRKDAGVSTTNVMILLSDGDAGTTDGGLTTSSTPSSANQCAQAVTAGQNAAKAGTWVYTVAFNPEATGCGTDSPAITPCQTMEDIAATSTGGQDAARFFSSYSGTQTGTTCQGRSQTDTSLPDIFEEIAGDLTVARLIPNGTS